MKLSQITIKNFRSIENLTLDFQKGNNSGMFGLLGINESGKSNILKAISLKDNLKKYSYEDFHRKESEEPVQVIYEFANEKGNAFLEPYLSKLDLREHEESFLKSFQIKKITITIEISKDVADIPSVSFDLTKNFLEDWGLDDHDNIQLRQEGNDEPLDLQKFLRKKLSVYVLVDAPKTIFWESGEKYLIPAI